MENEFTSYVYILACSDNSYYTGVTNDIERRLYEHDAGLDKESYTYIRRPLELKYLEQFDDINKAIEREKQIKKWSRKKKEALFEENYYLLKILSKKIRKSPIKKPLIK
jgi:putative endonuclease